MKEVGDSVHTGEKNLMPSILKRRVGKNTVASVDGECSRVRTETSCRSSTTQNKLGKKRDTAPYKENPIENSKKKKYVRYGIKKGENDEWTRQQTNKSMKDYERCWAQRAIERKQACQRAGSVAISVALPPLPSLVPSTVPLPRRVHMYTPPACAPSTWITHTCKSEEARARRHLDSL